jgi:hypothetical protein
MLVPKAATVEAPTYPPVAPQTTLDLPHQILADAMVPPRADLRLQCAAFNGKLGSGFGSLFNAQVDPVTDIAMAA